MEPLATAFVAAEHDVGHGVGRQCPLLAQAGCIVFFPNHVFQELKLFVRLLTGFLVGGCPLHQVVCTV